MGLPLSSVSISASFSTLASIRSATLFSTAARALPDRRLQRPSSKAARAAVIAASASTADPSAAWLTTTPCEGEIRSDVRPSALSCADPVDEMARLIGAAGSAIVWSEMMCRSFMSLSREFWFALFAERGDAFIPVGRGGDGSTSQRLDHRGAILALGGVDHGFGDLDRAWRQGDGAVQQGQRQRARIIRPPAATKPQASARSALMR